MVLTIIDKVFENQLLRKLYHLFGGGLMLLGLVILEQKWFLVAGTLYVVAFLTFGKRISFAAIGVLLLLILSGSKPLTIGATLIWLVGDGLAGLLGAAYGKKKWPWHSTKTFLGSASFFVGSFFAMWIWLQAHINAPLFTLGLLSFIACLAGSIVEALPITFIHDRKPDDNLTVILAPGLVVKILSFWLGVQDGF
jgi:dolichol kinase